MLEYLTVISVLNLMESQKYSPGSYKFLTKRVQNTVQRTRLIQWILVTVHKPRETELEPQTAEDNTKVQNIIFQEASYILYAISHLFL